MKTHYSVDFIVQTQYWLITKFPTRNSYLHLAFHFFFFLTIVSYQSHVTFRSTHMLFKICQFKYFDGNSWIHTTGQFHLIEIHFSNINYKSCSHSRNLVYSPSNRTMFMVYNIISDVNLRRAIYKYIRNFDCVSKTWN